MINSAAATRATALVESNFSCESFLRSIANVRKKDVDDDFVTCEFKCEVSVEYDAYEQPQVWETGFGSAKETEKQCEFETEIERQGDFDCLVTEETRTAILFTSPLTSSSSSSLSIDLKSMNSSSGWILISTGSLNGDLEINCN